MPWPHPSSRRTRKRKSCHTAFRRALTRNGSVRSESGASGSVPCNYLLNWTFPECSTERMSAFRLAAYALALGSSISSSASAELLYLVTIAGLAAFLRGYLNVTKWRPAGFFLILASALRVMLMLRAIPPTDQLDAFRAPY